MNERPRYLTDEEAMFDGAGEGFGVDSEVKKSLQIETQENPPVLTQSGEVSIVRANKLLQTLMEDFEPIIEKAKHDLEVEPPIMASPGETRQSPPDYMGVFMQDFAPIIDQAKRDLMGDTEEQAVIRMETDGIMIFEDASLKAE